MNDRAAIEAEVRDVFLAYEAALVAQDHVVLAEWFTTDPDVVRFGINDIEYGPDAVAAWRSRSPHVGDDRTRRNTVVTAVTDDVVVVATEFFRPGRPELGRQSQVWQRGGPRGWQIVHAHVSTVVADGCVRFGEPTR